jgi:phosphoglycerate dehydrogenase-like enzyme
MSGARILRVAVNLPPQVDFVDQALQDAFPEVRFLKARAYKELARVLPSCKVLVTNNSGYTPEVGRLVVGHAPGLEWIQFTTTGIDTALRSGLPSGAMVTNMRGVRAEVLATHAMALLLGVMRGLLRFEPLRARRQWQRDAMTPFTRTLENGTLVVVGLGSTGRSIARKARAFEMRVVGVSRHGRPVPDCERVVPHRQFREVLPEADALVLALPLTAETFHLLGRDELARMKPEAVVVNVARGGLIDEPALIAALQQGRLAGAGLDVVESEPLAPDSPLWAMPNVLLTPHIGGRGGVAPDPRIAALLADNLRRFQAGQELRNRVDARTGLALCADTDRPATDRPVVDPPGAGQ